MVEAAGATLLVLAMAESAAAEVVLAELQSGLVEVLLLIQDKMVAALATLLWRVVAEPILAVVLEDTPTKVQVVLVLAVRVL